MSPSQHPADSFMELQKSFGALNLSVFNGCISKQAYYVSSTAYQLCLAFNTNVALAVSVPSQYFFGVDTEVVARKHSLLSGINVNSSPMFFRAQIGQALANTSHTCNFWGYYDVILELDVASKNMVAKF